MSKSFKKIITLGDIFAYRRRQYTQTQVYNPLLMPVNMMMPALPFYDTPSARDTYDRDLFSKYRKFAPAYNSFDIAEYLDGLEDTTSYTERYLTMNSDDNDYWTSLVADELQTDCRNFLDTHSDAYVHIYDALGVEYKPLENYSMTESGSDTYGEDSTAHAYGQDSTSNAYGEQSSTLTTGAQETTNANGIYGYNSSDASNADTSTTSAGARTDTSTEAARTDTTTRAEHTDTDTRAEHIDSHSLTRSGNIGVTTSQQMLQSEIDLRKASIFWDLVTGDIIKSLFYLPDAGVTVL